MDLKEKVNKIVNDYTEFDNLFKGKGYDLDDYDEHYAIWLNETTKELAEDIQGDIVNLCEDNEVMVEAVKEYFSEDME